MAIQPASSTSVGAVQTTTSGPGACARRAVRRHRLVDPLRDRPGELVRDLDDLRSAAAVGRDLERRHRRVAVGEGDDVGDVRAAPLVDRLLVVADDAQLHLRAGQQLDQPLLRRVDVLVLVDDQVAQLGVDLARPAPGRSSSRTARTTCWP